MAKKKQVAEFRKDAEIPEDRKEFIAAWRDLSKYPSVSDVGAAFGISRQAASLRAQKLRRDKFDCPSREGTNVFLKRITGGGK